MRGRPRSVRVPVVKCSTLAPRARRSCGGERDIPEGRLAGGVGGGGKAAGCTGRAGSPREEAGWGSGAGGGEGAGARQESSRK